MNNIIGVRSQESGVRSQESGVRSQESGVRSLVSFCVPVYNNAEAAFSIVNDLLSYDDDRFEVVVSDNASTDNTQQRLSTIHDLRFKYHRNDENIGAHKNWEKALELGNGEYLYLVMGRDKLHSEDTGRLLELLQYASQHNVTHVRDVASDLKDNSTYSGIDAMTKFLIDYHQTGCILKRPLFHQIPNRTRYFEIADMHPENFVIRDLLLKGNGMFIHSGVFRFEVLIDLAAVKSTVEHNLKLEDTYYAPRRKTKHYFELFDMVASDCREVFSASEIDRYMGVKFYNLLLTVSYHWRQYCKNMEWQAHYGQTVRNVGLLEMVRNVLAAHTNTKAHLKAQGTYSLKRGVIMCGITAAVLAKITVYSPVMVCVRKVCSLLKSRKH